MIKLAVITDIHGNSPALAAVLHDISSRGVDHIYCLGDVVGIGPNSNEVLELLLSRTDVSFVIGNHDVAVIAAFRGQEAPEGHQSIRHHHQWLADRINPVYIEVMSKWTKQLIINHFDKQLLFTHYHLTPDGWFMDIEKNPTEENLDRLYNETNYKLVCFGHHHIVHDFVASKRAYFNPGALGCYDKPLARYGIVTLTENAFNEELIEVPYDNTEFLQSYHQLLVPEREFILKIFHGGQLA
ncbi:metallophosphoesterase family protein [Paenibacillus sp. GD4]|uniref:metallophosphoesterase family protein n=1 Tax=Paenibacillus sp. GD4 TaxID=3068890 RepID=UPI002796B754|nr:metallophosphoesterase family protein [Paenibacillus sp. GD4]MDQ1913731.1 metallophosphoesterase family protein [Paenibacillus sp. GD4]